MVPQSNMFELLRDKSILAILDGDVDFGEIETYDSKGNIKISMPYLSGPSLCDISSRFGDGVKAAIKKRMLEEFGLHTIIRLPMVFKPYANVNTNLLFFQKGVASKGVWFYRLDYPQGIKSFTKTKPMQDKHFDPVREWWDNKQPIIMDGKDKARYYSVEDLAAYHYDFDKCCPFPHEEEEILEPADLIARYQAERSELNMDIDRILGEITATLGVQE